MFKFALLLIPLSGGMISFWIWRSRKQSILGVRGRNRHFRYLADQLHLMQGGDDYFTQLEGEWKGFPILVYPHNFHGPGSITLFYADTGIPFKARTWLEPSLSLGRAIVDWQRHVPFQYDYSGDPILKHETILNVIQRHKEKLPFIAITLPTRFIFSHYVMQALSSWPNFVVLVALDAGRNPSVEEMEEVLDATVEIAQTVRSVVLANQEGHIELAKVQPVSN
jgi:hypothetical protein